VSDNNNNICISLLQKVMTFEVATVTVTIKLCCLIEKQILKVCIRSFGKVRLLSVLNYVVQGEWLFLGQNFAGCRFATTSEKLRGTKVLVPTPGRLHGCCEGPGVGKFLKTPMLQPAFW